jgi:SAM-dependent methyltransferase
MDLAGHVRPSFPADAFAGTAGYYVRYRVPYPKRLLRDLVDRSGVTGGGRLLDLACGPGRLAFDLASSFREVWAIDLEPEMIETARKEDVRRGAGNIRWMVGRAESLEAPAASFELITAGEAFHRLDQRIVAEQALKWLRPGCHLATLGCYTVLSGAEPWQRIVVDAVRRWTSGTSQLGGDSGARNPGSGPDHNERVLREHGFVDVASHSFVEPHEWTLEAIIGYLYSTSVCSRNRLGNGAAGFEADLRAELLSFDPGGVFRESTSWGYTIGRRPE